MYKPRNIRFKEHKKIGDWHIKIYTISDKDIFASIAVYNEAMGKISEWLKQLNSFNPRHYNVAFVIIHEATEGVFTLVNTWIGGSMLQTHVFLTEYKEENVFTKISGDGLFACVWELAIIENERKAWLKYILQRNDHPDYQAYLEEIINTTF